ncbi:hypothetical protein AKJ16_DCAP22550 [Drosera capensis]
MAKNRNKKKNKTGKAPMDISVDSITVSQLPQDMDTWESGAAPVQAVGSLMRKVKGVQMKRSKNARKMKAKAKAISKTEKLFEKACNYEMKKIRVKFAKTLYD